MSGSGRGRVESLTLSDLGEWFLAMGLDVEGPDAAVAEQLRDGVILCHLVNKIKPGSIEVVSSSLPQFRSKKLLVVRSLASSQIKQMRLSGDAEENILRFLQACTTLGIKKVSVFFPEGGQVADM